MSGNSGESFDFSSPFDARTIEVAPQTNVSESSFAARFEQAKTGAVPNPEPIKTASADSQDEVLVSYSKNHKKQRSHGRPTFGQWLTTFVLLLCLCAVSTFALINYKDSSQKLADAERAAQVAGARTSGPKVLTTAMFTLSTADSIPSEFVLQENKTKFLTGFDRSFFVSSYLASRGSGDSRLQSGIEVYMQERATTQTSASLIEQLKKNYLLADYPYPDSIQEGSQVRNTLTPQNTVLPTVAVVLTSKQVYIIVQYNQIAEHARIVKEMVSGLRLN